jgi:trehalose 6-phosphate phosphatase
VSPSSRPGPESFPRPLQALVDEAGRALVGLDYDGSLAPIVTDPAAARVLPAARDALAALVPLVGRVAVVSGRPAAFLAEHVGLEGVTYAGIYGLERWEGAPGSGRVVVDPRVEDWSPVVAGVAAAAEAELPGVLVERKGLVAVTLHWRSAPALEDRAAAWAAAAAAREGLAVVPGRLAAELRPPVPVDKGTTVTDLARGASSALFAGDDAGDLPAFAGLRALVTRGELPHAVTVGVRSDESPDAIAAQDVVVEGPAGLAELLAALAAAISARG